MVDLEWMNSSGQRGQSVDHPPRATGVKRTPIDVYFTPSAKDKHHSAVSVLESFGANAIVSNQKNKRCATQATNSRSSALHSLHLAVKNVKSRSSQSAAGRLRPRRRRRLLDTHRGRPAGWTAVGVCYLTAFSSHCSSTQASTETFTCLFRGSGFRQEIGCCSKS